MATHFAGRFVEPEHAYDERWHAWLAKGTAHDRLINRRLVFAAAVAACILAGSVLVAIVVG